MLKLIIVYVVALEVAQWIAILLICLLFFLWKYVFKISDKTFQNIIQTVSYKKIVIGSAVVELISLFAIIPYSFWWFSLWDVNFQVALSISIPILSFLFFIGKMIAVKKYMVNKYKDLEVKNDHIYH